MALFDDVLVLCEGQHQTIIEILKPYTQFVDPPVRDLSIRILDKNVHLVFDDWDPNAAGYLQWRDSAYKVFIWNGDSFWLTSPASTRMFVCV